MNTNPNTLKHQEGRLIIQIMKTNACFFQYDTISVGQDFVTEDSVVKGICQTSSKELIWVVNWVNLFERDVKERVREGKRGFLLVSCAGFITDNDPGEQHAENDTL